jgi:hypothetical protein
MNELDKDVLDHLCATDPIWGAALQILQLARRLSDDEPVLASTQVVCALVLLASEVPNPQEFLDHYADTLRKTPMKQKDRP